MPRKSRATETRPADRAESADNALKLGKSAHALWLLWASIRRFVSALTDLVYYCENPDPDPLDGPWLDDQWKSLQNGRDGVEEAAKKLAGEPIGMDAVELQVTADRLNSIAHDLASYLTHRPAISTRPYEEWAVGSRRQDVEDIRNGMRKLRSVADDSRVLADRICQQIGAPPGLTAQPLIATQRANEDGKEEHGAVWVRDGWLHPPPQLARLLGLILRSPTGCPHGHIFEQLGEGMRSKADIRSRLVKLRKALKTLLKGKPSRITLINSGGTVRGEIRPRPGATKE